MQQLEQRVCDGSQSELRATATRGVSGYAAVYGVKSRPIPLPSRGSFTEIISAGAFTRALSRNPDVRGLLEHDPAKMFGRTKSGTMKLSDTTKGLFFDVPTLPATGVGPLIIEQLERGDLDGCSFRFQVPRGGDTWSTERVGGAEVVLRTIQDLDLSDVSLTAFPVYPETTVALRSLEQWSHEQKQQGVSVQKIILDILRAKWEGSFSGISKTPS